MRFLLAPFLSFVLAASPVPHTRLVLLGTGTPIPDPSRSGPAVAVVSGGQAYLFDAGPGVVRRAAAAYEKGIVELNPVLLTRVFFTHLHSDHTAGYPDLMLTPWPIGRRAPLEAYGPKGLKAMTEHIDLAYAEDYKIRSQGLEGLDPTGRIVNAHEVEPGVVYKDARVTISAFAVHHGSWPVAFGYRVEAPDRVIVISGDTSAVQSVVEACHECDILVHEVHTGEGPYMDTFHTSVMALAGIARKAKPKLLVLYHQLYFNGATDESILKELRALYTGEVAAGKDLEVY